MDEKDFELLRVLEETRNITHAADRLYMTQSALSKRIRAIEQELDVEILLRSRQGIRFTPAGELVLARSSAAAREMEGLRDELGSLAADVYGTLHAGVSINYAQYRLPDILAAYHRNYPHVRLQISTGQSRNLFRDLQDGTLDVAVLRGDYPWEGERFLLSQERICVIVSRENENTPLEDLLYVSHKTDPALAGLVTRWMRENGLNREQAGLCVDNITTCMEMVRRGIGWGIIPEICLDSFDGAIRPCYFSNGEPFVRRTYLMYQAEAARLRQVQAFIEAMKTAHTKELGKNE